MKTIIYSILISILISSCGFVEEIGNSSYVAPEFQPYLDKFYEEADRLGAFYHHKKVYINFSNLKDMNGLSHNDFNSGFNKKHAHIEIDRDYYNSLTRNTEGYNLGIERLVFHELGHALLHRGHTNDVQDSTVVLHTIFKGDTLKTDRLIMGIPVSIMHKGGSFNTYERDREEYLKELFNI